MRSEKIQEYLFFGLLGLITLFFLWLIKPFLIPIFWAIVFAILFYPLYKEFLTFVKKRKSLASLLTIFSVLIVVVLPLYLFGSIIFHETQTLFINISSDNFAEAKVDILDTLSAVSRFLEPYGVDQEALVTRARSAFETAGVFLTEQIVSIGRNVLGFIFNLVITFYVLFFLLRDGDRIVARLKHLLPLGKRREDRLFKRITEITRGSVKGEFLIALIQGLSGGILFWIAGINAPALWGLAMGLFAFLPGVGTALVWLPAALLLLISGQVPQGLIVLIGGVLFVGVIDNMIRPFLVSRGTQIPDMFVLISTLGGLFLFGLSGVIIGPLIAGLLLTMWEMFGETYKDKLDEL